MKRKMVNNFILYLLLIISGTFGISSAIILFNSQLRRETILANSTYTTKKSDIHSVKNITSQNISSKVEILDSIDPKKLTYSQELTDLNESNTFYDKDGSLYIYDNQDNLVSYMQEDTSIDNTGKISEDEALTLASEYLSEFVDNNNYTLQDIRYDNNCNTYSIAYGNPINGVRTTDIVYLIIKCDGTLVGYSFQNLGEFDNDTINEQQLDLSKEKAIALAKETYGDSLTEEKVEDIVLGKSNDEKVLYISISGTITETDSTYELNDIYTISVNSL